MVRKQKRGQVWVSAVLFISLGVIIIALILAGAMPLVNKISDKNTVVRTKGIVLTMDDAIRTVVNEGPGSQRQLNPVVIDKGSLTIQEGAYELRWELETNAVLMEKDVQIEEGHLSMVLNSTFVEEMSRMTMWVDDDGWNITIPSPLKGPLKGSYVITVKHTGIFDASDRPLIDVTIS